MVEEPGFWRNINQFIEMPISQDILLPIVQYLIIPLILLWITYKVVQRGIEKYKHTNTKELKIDDYYQDVSKEVLIGLIQDWTDLLNNTSFKMYLMRETAKKEIPSSLLKKHPGDIEPVKMTDGNQFEKVDAQVYSMGKLIMSTWIYGKKETNLLLSNYQKHNYKDMEDKNKAEKQRHSTKSIVYVAMIIVSLREDLMNFKADPIGLVELKINDISKPENYKLFSELIEEIKNEIREVK